MNTKHRTGSQTPARRALIIIDVQPTFRKGDVLPVTGGNAVAEYIVAYLLSHRGDYDLVATTQDWHIDPGEHFPSEPDFVDTWPIHGVVDSAEVRLHPALSVLEAGAVVRKGQYAAVYSSSEGINKDGRILADTLSAAGIEVVDTVGLVESHYVRDTALDVVRQGYRMRVLTDLTESVSPELGRAARVGMSAVGTELVLSH